MNYQIVSKFPNDILFEQEGPFISLYLPTHRHAPENKQDTIVFKNLLKTAESSLAQKYTAADIESIMNPLLQMETDADLWNNTLDGMAVLCSVKQCVLYLLHETVKPLVIVAERFHTKPLIKAFQSMDQYQLLGLTIDAFDMFQGNQNGIAKLRLPPGAPRDIEAVLGEQLTDAYLTQGSFNGPGRTAMYHGHGGAKPEIDKDTEKFFRYVDRFVLETYSKPSKLPLILVALKEHHATFAEVSDNPYLLPQGIRGEYSAFSMEKLREKTWEILEPMYLSKMKSFVERFEQAKANGNGTNSLTLISKAIFENRVDTLFVDVDRIIPGKISLKDGKVLDRTLANPDIGDVLDELAQLALRGGSDVVVLPSALMPGETGIAAIFRY